MVESIDTELGVRGVEGDTPKQSVSGKGVGITVVGPTVLHVRGGYMVESASPIAKRVWNEPCMQHPSILQSSP